MESRDADEVLRRLLAWPIPQRERPWVPEAVLWRREGGMVLFYFQGHATATRTNSVPIRRWVEYSSLRYYL